MMATLESRSDFVWTYFQIEKFSTEICLSADRFHFSDKVVILLYYYYSSYYITYGYLMANLIFWLIFRNQVCSQIWANVIWQKRVSNKNNTF